MLITSKDIVDSATILPLYQAYTQFTPVLPKLYWDVYSQEERIKAICFHIDKLVAYCNEIGLQVNRNTEIIEKLQEEFEDFLDGGYDDVIEKVVDAWVDSNMTSIMSRACRQVFFGLTSNGYFCAYIPESWSDIIFDTGMIYNRSDYGRLILRYNVDGATGVIDNTGMTGDMQVANDISNIKTYIKQLSKAVDGNGDNIDNINEALEKIQTTLYSNIEEGE